MNLVKIGVKTISSISTVLAIQTITALSAYAGPALSFRFDYLGLNQSECMQRASNALIQTGLQAPQNLINLNNTPFLSGESSSITTIIDCSMANQTGRVTLMVTHTNNINTALNWANDLLDRMR